DLQCRKADSSEVATQAAMSAGHWPVAHRLRAENQSHRRPGCPRALVVEHNARLAGMIVDSASEVLKIPSTEIEPPPAVLQVGGMSCVTGLGNYKGRLIMLLDMNKLLEFSGLRPAKAAAEESAPKAEA